MAYISNNGEGSSNKSDRNLALDASEYASQSRSSNQDNGSRTKGYPKLEEENKIKEEEVKQIKDKIKDINSSSSIYDEEVRAYNKTDPRQEDEFIREDYHFEFYVDGYSDDKIKEIISIFRNDFKPPKNLWIENMKVQGTAEADYFNDVFADDDNYHDTEEASPKAADSSSHNEEIDDIGCNMFKDEKPKAKKEETKGKISKEAATMPGEDKKEEKKYTDRIKPTDKKADEIQPQTDMKEEQKEDEQKTSQKDSSKSSKGAKKKKSPEQPERDYKMQKAKDGLNIEIPSDHIPEVPRKPSKPDSVKSGKKSSKTPKNSTGEDFNKTRKLPPNILEGLSDEDMPSDHNEEPSNISIGRIAKE